jgi:hypothetical protein
MRYHHDESCKECASRAAPADRQEVGALNVVIETPRGCPNKFKFDGKQPLPLELCPAGRLSLSV